MENFDKEKIKLIALTRFHDKGFDSYLDFVLYVIEIYLKQEKLQIVKAPDADPGEA